MRHFPRIKALHEETLKPMYIPPDEKDWPLSWKVVEYKEYPRFPRVTLPPPDSLAMPVSECLSHRASQRNFSSDWPKELKDLSSLFYWACGKKNDGTESRHYPSGGGRYPLEIYFAHQGSPVLRPGVYHYNVKGHCLEKIGSRFDCDQIYAFPNYPWARTAPFFFFITAVFDRTMQKYRERGYRFALLEAGIVLQNFYLVATAIKLSMCALGVNFDREAASVLRLDERRERLVSAFVLGGGLVKKTNK